MVLPTFNLPLRILLVITVFLLIFGALINSVPPELGDITEEQPKVVKDIIRPLEVVGGLFTGVVDLISAGLTLFVGGE